MTEVDQESADYVAGYEEGYDLCKSVRKTLNEQLTTTRAELAAKDAMIHQLGENAAKAAGEYAEEVGWLRAANMALRNGYADAASGLAYVRQHHGNLYGVGFDRVADWFFELVTMPEREGLAAGYDARAALTEPTDG